jgi:hypothetical protein
LALADDIWLDILTEWLVTGDIRVLDDAVCSKFYRPPFLVLLARDIVKLSFGATGHANGLLPWIARRNIQFRTLSLEVTGEKLDALMPYVTSRAVGKVVELRLYGDRKKSTTRIATKLVDFCCAGLTTVLMQRFDTRVQFLHKCPALTCIIFDSCPKVTDKDLELISEHCPLLQKIHLEKCSAITCSSLRLVGQRCRQLKYLFVKAKISGFDLAEPAAVTFPELRMLSLEVLTYGDDSNRFVVAMVNAAPKLTHFRSWVINLSDAAVLAILNRPRPPPLEEMVLFLGKITDATLAVIGEHCPNLKIFSSMHNNSYTEEGVTSLTQRLPNCHFDFRSCKNIPKAARGSYNTGALFYAGAVIRSDDISSVN